jgi:ribose/xylose/arabinose/galactoside ABC-type transport system permease subunit
VASVVGPYVGLLLVVALFGALDPRHFLSAENFRKVALQTVIVGLCTLGTTFVVVSGGIDLSIGSTTALAAVVTAWLLRAGHGAFVAIGGGMAVGAVTGLVNGLLVTRLRIVPFVVTLGTLGAARGVAKWIGDEQPVRVDLAAAERFRSFMEVSPTPSWLVVAPGVWLLFALAAVMVVVLRRTVFGVWTVALGSSEATARLCGVPVARTRTLLYVLGGLFAGLAGVMSFARLTVGDPTGSVGLELKVIAAVVIGGASLSGGEGSIGGSLVGAFLMTFLESGCNLVGLANYVQEIVIGAIIVGAVAVDRVRAGRSGPS